MNKRQAKKAMNKAQNRPIQTQDEYSKLIKRINTNIRAIGEKYGKNSMQYLSAVQKASDIFENVEGRVGYTAIKKDKNGNVIGGGWFAIRNIKENKTPLLAVKMRELAIADEMSLSNLRKASKQQLSAMPEGTRYKIEEKARERLLERGISNPTRTQVNNEMIEVNTSYVSGLDWVVNNTDVWYKLALVSDEIQRVKNLLKTKGRRKEYDEISDIVDTIRSEIDRIEREKKEGAELAHNEHEGEITFNSHQLMTREEHANSHFGI